MTSLTYKTYLVKGLRISLGILKEISDDLPPPATAIINLAQRVVDAAEAVETNREDCRSLRDRILQLLPVITKAIKDATPEGDGPVNIPSDVKENLLRLHSNLESCLLVLNKVNDKMNSTRKRDKIVTLINTKPYSSDIQKCKDDLEWAMTDYQVLSSISDAVRLCEVWRSVTEVQSGVGEVSRKVDTVQTTLQDVVAHTVGGIEGLPRARSASHEYDRPDRPSSCLPGTRAALLAAIRDWMTNQDSTTPPFFWLKGLAGTGKTTIARSIAEGAKTEGLLGADFFFSRRGEAELRDPSIVFPTLAYQLARFDSEFKKNLLEALAKDPDAPRKARNIQLDKLIVEPIERLERDPARMVIIVFDAFDECEAKGSNEILQLLVAAMPRFPYFLKIFLTSRDEPHIRSVLVPSRGLKIAALHEIEENVVQSDIRLYLWESLKTMGRMKGLEEDWVSETDVDILAGAAGNIFIHASTSIRFLTESLLPQQRLKILLEMLIPSRQWTHSSNPYGYLDQLYRELLLLLIPRGDESRAFSSLRAVLGSLVLLRDPLPVDAIGRLAGLEDDEGPTVFQQLHSVILPPVSADDCPRIYHPSFSDFLQSRERCGDDRLWINHEEGEVRMALGCLRMMNQSLHLNMLGTLEPALLNSQVPDVETRVAAAYVPDLRYACLFWSSHLEAAPIAASTFGLMQALDQFVSRTLLPWLEAMSWLERTRLALTALETARVWAEESGCTAVTLSLLRDGYRMLSDHFPSISASASHLTRSALPFVPRGTEIHKFFSTHVHPDVNLLLGAEQGWSSKLATLRGHQDEVVTLAVSSTGSYVVSGSLDNTIKVWDATSGEELQTMRGHTGPIYSVVFSADGAFVASGSKDCTVRIWNRVTAGEMIKLTGHDVAVYAVVFSSDGMRIASGDRDGRLRICDALTGILIQTLSGHSGEVTSVAFSPDGLLLASGSTDTTVKIWRDGQCVRTFVGHTPAVISITYSSDGSQIASSSDGVIRLWDCITGKRVRTLRAWPLGQEFTGPLSFSRDISVAVASMEKGPRVPSEKNAGMPGKMQLPFWLCNELYNRGRIVRFSPDGVRVVSTSAASIILWDATNVTNREQTPGHTQENEITAVTLTEDGSLLAFASRDGAIKLCNLVTGNDVQTLKCFGNEQGIYRYIPTFANDVRRVAIRNIRSMTFSPDGRYLLLGGLQKILVWDTDTWKERLAADFDQKWPAARPVTSVAFSRDNLHFAGGLGRGPIKLWDAKSFQLLQTLDYRWTDRVAFSHCGMFLYAETFVGDRAVWNLRGERQRDGFMIIPPDERVKLSPRSSHTRSIDRVEPSNGGSQPLIILPSTLSDPCTSAFQPLSGSRSGCRTALGYKDGRLVVMDLYYPSDS